MRELSEPLPGCELLAKHLAQALLVEALRAYLRNRTDRDCWLAVLAHPSMQRVLSACTAMLPDAADVAGMSRSRFAVQFEHVTGETPIAHLTRWLIMLAADRMTNAAVSLAEVAASVGYESERAFGAAFRRVAGRSPRRSAKREPDQCLLPANGLQTPKDQDWP